jgi:hypothetical protein
MAAENVATVKRAIAAVNARDVDSYLGCCTDDVRLRTPLAPIEGSYEGAAGIRRFFSDVAATGPDFRLEIERIDAVGPNRVLTFMRVVASGRESGVDMGTETTNVYDLVDGKIRWIEIFTDRQEALGAAKSRT